MSNYTKTEIFGKEYLQSRVYPVDPSKLTDIQKAFQDMLFARDESELERLEEDE